MHEATSLFLDVRAAGLNLTATGGDLRVSRRRRLTGELRRRIREPKDVLVLLVRRGPDQRGVGPGAAPALPAWLCDSVDPSDAAAPPDPPALLTNEAGAALIDLAATERQRLPAPASPSRSVDLPLPSSCSACGNRAWWPRPARVGGGWVCGVCPQRPPTAAGREPGP